MNYHPLNAFRNILRRIEPKQSELLNRLDAFELRRPIILSPSFHSGVGVKSLELTLSSRDACGWYRPETVPSLSSQEATLRHAIESLVRTLSTNPSVGALLGYLIALEPMRCGSIDGGDNEEHLGRLERCAEQFFVDESVALVADDYAFFTLDFIAAAARIPRLDITAP